jgi:hypothetical protein
VDGPAAHGSAEAGQLVAADLVQGDDPLGASRQPRRGGSDPLRLLRPPRRDVLNPVLGLDAVQDVPRGYADHTARSWSLSLIRSP